MRLNKIWTDFGNLGMAIGKAFYLLAEHGPTLWVFPTIGKPGIGIYEIHGAGETSLPPHCDFRVVVQIDDGRGWAERADINIYSPIPLEPEQQCQKKKQN